MTKISSRLNSKLVVFSGFDGNEYTAFVEKVRNGVATLVYRVSVQGVRREVKAYVSEADRIRLV